MNKTSYGFLVLCWLLLCNESLFSQWNWQSPIPQGNDLFKVQFINDALGWAVGEYGTALHTTNAGTTWYEQEFGRTDNILGINMVSDTEGWATGDNGIILHTTDAGDDWVEQTSGVSVGLNSLDFTSQLEGWVAGDNEVILHTTNGGSSWTIQHQAGNNGVSINSIMFLNSNEGWAAAGNRVVFHTTDGGSNWIRQSVGIAPTSYLSVYFVNTSLGFLAGTNGVILRTDDGGTMWTQITSGVNTNLNNILMQNSFVGWIVGDAGTLLKTINGGQSWSLTMIGDGNDINGLSKFGGTLWAVGGLGKILLSTNSGVAWGTNDVGSRLSANWMDFPTLNVGVAVGQTGLIMRTTDGGHLWLDQTSPTPSVSCYGVKFISSTTGWAVGDNGTILHTHDGETWTTQSSSVTHSLLGITFGNFANGWIVGGEFTNFTGIILHTTDAGNSWSVQYNNVPHILYGISFPNATTGWAVGEVGTILHTTDAGTTWVPETSGVSNALFWCSFLDLQNGWAVGELGRILYTTNGGTTWNPQASGVTVDLYSVVARDLLDALVAGDKGVILHTSDRGIHWDNQYSRTQHSLFGVTSPFDSVIWACGDYGTVLADTIARVNGSVPGIVFYDINNNGFYDAGEPGMQGWRIVLGGDKVDSTLSGPDGSFRFNGLLDGSYTLSQVAQSSWTPTVPVSPASYSFTINSTTPNFSGNFGNYAPHGYPYKVNNRWNLVSLPLLVTDARKSIVYPNAISPAFEFEGVYIQKDTLRPGTGYWLKFPSPQTVWIPGEAIHTDSFSLAQGWNLIGTINDTVPAASVTTNPPGVITSPIYKYSTGYIATSVIVPGQGYWVRVSAAGKIIMTSPGHHAPMTHSLFTQFNRSSNLNKISITDCDGGSQSLFFGRANELKDPQTLFDLPPLPPNGSFDARFENGSTLALFDSANSQNNTAIITIQASCYPVTIAWHVSQPEGLNYSLRDPASNRELVKSMSDSGSVVIDNPAITVISLQTQAGNSSPQLPNEFALMQNLPNPFNPTTTIRFVLPVLSKVQLSIFTILGQKVATLADGNFDAGTHDIHWTPSLASGLYFYRIDAVSLDGKQQHFIQTRKMVLLK